MTKDETKKLNSLYKKYINNVNLAKRSKQESKLAMNNYLKLAPKTSLTLKRSTYQTLIDYLGAHYGDWSVAHLEWDNLNYALARDYKKLLALKPSKNAKTVSISIDLLSDVICDAVSTLRDLNGEDSHDNLLKSNIEIEKSVLLLYPVARAHKALMTLTNHKVSSGDMWVDQISLYKHNVKSMEYEANHYWDKVKKYGWGTVVRTNDGKDVKLVNE